MLIYCLASVQGMDVGSMDVSFSSTSVGEGETSAGSLWAFCHLSLPPCFSRSLSDVQNMCGCRCQILTCGELF